MIKYSAYWPVKGNIKPSAMRFNHIEELRKKNIDVFFGDEKYNLDAQEILLKEIPGIKYLKDFPKVCIAKHGYKFPKNTYEKLCGIWFSKILLLDAVRELHPNHNYYTWVDCIKTFNLEHILESTSNKIVVNKYTGKRLVRLKQKLSRHMPFRKLIKLENYIHGCVIKCPNNLIDEFIEKFFLEVEILNSSKIIYDEEIVLSFMCDKYPELFELIEVEDGPH